MLFPFLSWREAEAGWLHTGLRGRSVGGSLQPWPRSPPHTRFAHGGSLIALVDEAFAKTAYLAGEGLITISLSIRFQK